MLDKGVLDASLILLAKMRFQSISPAHVDHRMLGRAGGVLHVHPAECGPAAGEVRQRILAGLGDPKEIDLELYERGSVFWSSTS